MDNFTAVAMKVIKNLFSETDLMTLHISKVELFMRVFNG